MALEVAHVEWPARDLILLLTEDCTMITLFLFADLQILFPFSVDFGFPITQTFEIGRKKRDLISSTEDDHYAVLDHALHGPLHKVDALLYTLGVEDQSCVESSICLIHQKYEDYQPLSNLIEKILLM